MKDRPGIRLMLCTVPHWEGVLIAALWTLSSVLAETPAGRQQIDLGGTWRFQADRRNEGESAGWFSPEHGAGSWRQVSVPVAFDQCGPDLERYAGVGWFRRHVHIPESFRGRRIVLDFEGINYNAKVWVNGILAGENHDAFLPFSVPVGDALRIGAENLVAVRIDNLRSRGQFPLFEGWYGQGGFLREARLLATDQTYVVQTFVEAEPAAGGGQLRLRATAMNGARRERPVQILAQVLAEQGKELATLQSATVPLAPGQAGELSLEGVVPGVPLWSPDQPALCTVRLTLLSGKEPLDTVTRRVGFRRVEAKAGQLLLNGEPLFLMGFNRHEDSPRTGMAVDLEQARDDLTEIKRLGGNFVRLCHYPHHPGELDLCDELGLLVLAENAMNEWGHLDHPDPNGGFALAAEDAPLVLENARRSLRAMVQRDNHHPSIVLWSVSNENAEERSEVAEGNQELIRYGQSLDPSRPWTHVSNSHQKQGRESFYRHDDVIVVNVYPSHHCGRTRADLDAGLPEATKEMERVLAALHRQFPEKPIVIGEFGYPGGESGPEGAELQAIASEAEFRGLGAPYVAGCAFWVYARHPWADDAVYSGGKNVISPYGYVSRDRKTRFPALSVVARLFRQRADRSRGAGLAEPAAGAGLVFSCRADNDLYRVVTVSDRAYPRFDTPAEAVAAAPEGAGLLLLADGYPRERTPVDEALFQAARGKALRLYVEYPSGLPGLIVKDTAYVATGPYGSVLERTVIASEAFRPRLEPLRILVVNDCHYLPVVPRPETPHLVLARVAGYATAKLGLPAETTPILFEWPDTRAWVATTKLSQFVSARYAPTEAWGSLWQTILHWLQPGTTVPALTWTPVVRPHYARDGDLPADAGLEAIGRAARWYRQSRLLVAEDWEPWDPNTNPGIRPLPAHWSVGDGSLGIAECYISKRVFQDGSQALQPSVRADCVAESAMGLALAAAVTGDASCKTIAQNLNDFLWFRSAMATAGPQADPQRPSYGLLGHNAAAPGNTHFWGDDNARVLLGAIASSSLLGSDRWDEALLRTALASFRLTGPKGYHAGGLIPQEDLERNGWQYYWNWDGTDFSPHYQSYKWAVYLWFYDKTRFQPLLDRSRTGIRLMMEAYPSAWSAECGRMEEERTHMLLPLAWLVRVEDTPEHRQWLETMAQFVFETLTPAGAIPQMVDTPYAANAQYGAGEAPIVYETGDPGTDLLYTMNFAFSGMHEAAAATGDPRYAEAVERMAGFLIRAQTRSEARPELDGTWFRAFDFDRWEYWGSDGDAGWGVWTTETGWTHSWITATLALRQTKTSLWEVSRERRVGEHFEVLRRRMLPDAMLREPVVERTDHAARGRPVKLAQVYHSAYAAAGPDALTDGRRGSTSLPYANWQGFEGEDLDATIDLGQPTAVRSLSCTCLQNTPLGIYLPTEVTYLLSGDGQQFALAAKVPGAAGDRPPGPFIQAFTTTFPEASARYVRIHAKSLRTIPAGHPAVGAKAWLFADEIMVNGPAEETSGKTPHGDPGLYREVLRPQFHFTYRKGWLSDINGLVFHDGEYHLFSQHCPATTACDYPSMHWGHAVSRDLVHWRELPPAIAPDATNGPPFSGSAVVDWQNTSGFQTGAAPPLVAFYTGARYMLPAEQPGVICIAYSNDRGRTWTKYQGNPVLKAIAHFNRDPKVLWHAPTRRWIMVITLSCASHWLDGDYRFALLTSPDLKHWTEASRFEMPRGLDCPDLFELPVDGDARNTRWVFWAGDGTHAIGTFDGQTFTPDGDIRLPLLTWEQNGANGYAAQTFSDMPAADGRRIQTAWLRHGSYPGMPFSQQTLFPCEVTLQTTPGGIQVLRRPIREIELLHGTSHRWQDLPLSKDGSPVGGAVGELLDIRAEVELGDLATVELEARGIPIAYDTRVQSLSCQGATVPLAPVQGRIRLQVLVDRASVEVFANDGRVSLSFGCHPDPGADAVRLTANGGTGRVVDLTAHTVRSVWDHPATTAEASAGPGEAVGPHTISLLGSPFVFGAGGVGNSMDAMPFYHQGRWHLFLMQTAPLGLAHRVSTDLVHWQVRPLAIPGPAATGSVVEHQGLFYFFLTVNQTVHLATSEDLDHWTLHDRNPVATVDGRQYAGPDFRDPYVFYHEPEGCWWLLITTRIPGVHPMRAGCVGVYKSRDLLEWTPAEPLWAPGLGPHLECPQVIRQNDTWYLFAIGRQDQYRVARSLAGPWLRPPKPDLGPHTVLTGSRVASDGTRWISLPFLCARRGNDDFGEVVQAEVHALPRQLDFHPDGSITERPVDELIQALHAQAPVAPLAKAAIVSGSWDLTEDAAASAHSGTLLLSNVPSDCYLEADVTLDARHVEAAILLRADAELTRGYRLELRADEGIVALRPFSYWDRDRVLISGRIDLPTAVPFKVRVFISGTVMEAFIDERLVLTSRVYRHPEGQVALTVAEGKAVFGNLLVRRLYGDNREADGPQPKPAEP